MLLLHNRIESYLADGDYHLGVVELAEAEEDYGWDISGHDDYKNGEFVLIMKDCLDFNDDWPIHVSSLEYLTQFLRDLANMKIMAKARGSAFYTDFNMDTGEYEFHVMNSPTNIHGETQAEQWERQKLEMKQVNEKLFRKVKSPLDFLTYLTTRGGDFASRQAVEELKNRPDDAPNNSSPVSSSNGVDGEYQ